MNSFPSLLPGLSRITHHASRLPLFALFAFFCGQSFAQDANVIPFQGQLANQAGQPLTPTNAVTLVFRLYTAPVAGTAIWEESQPNISVNAGRFSVLLGSRTQLPAQSYFNSTLYLGITVDDGDPQTADVEMRPRQALVPVISASYAKNADKLQGYDWSVFVGATNPVDGRIQGSKIADASLPASKIADGTMPASKIVEGSITSNQLAVAAIYAGNIAESNITLVKLAQEVVDSLVPPGTIAAFGGEIPPRGWLLCDGAPYPASGAPYNRLYTAIGVSWGFVYPGQFRVPDLRGYFLRGKDPGLGRDPDSLSRTEIAAGGATGNAVGSLQADAFRSHSHTVSVAKNPGLSDTQGWPSLDNHLSLRSSDHFASVNGGSMTAGGLVENSGDKETRPKNAYVNYIIKY